jgi:hypothetical protein
VPGLFRHERDLTGLRRQSASLMGNTFPDAGQRVRFGHRVLETTEGSPSREARLVPFLDVIVAVDEVPLVRSHPLPPMCAGVVPRMRACVPRRPCAPCTASRMLMCVVRGGVCVAMRCGGRRPCQFVSRLRPPPLVLAYAGQRGEQPREGSGARHRQGREVHGV